MSENKPTYTSSVTVEMMATAREQRVMLQNKLIMAYNKPLICLTMNIAGPKKRSELIDIAFFEAVRCIKQSINILHEEYIDSATGNEAFFVVDCSSIEAKDIAISIENGSALGRLFDIDVLDLDGQKLSRSKPRRCLICEDMAQVCARSRKHTVNELFSCSENIIKAWLSDALAGAAHDALVCEVRATPKPGLVDSNDSGAHSDMDLNSFIVSAEAIMPYFAQIALAAMNCNDATQLMPHLISIGIEAEKAMYSATGGINTHKGAIYTIGLLCAGVAHAAIERKPIAEAFTFAQKLSSYQSAIAGRNVGETVSSMSHGELVYKSTGETGVRGEAMRGFPAVAKALRLLKLKTSQGETKNNAIVYALLHIMTFLSDTNVLYRCGETGLSYMHQSAKDALNGNFIENAHLLNAEYIKRRLSPGGAADVIAAALFLLNCEPFFACSHGKSH